VSKWWINGMPYTCENSRFMTNINKGHSHGPHAAGGSVFPTPLISHGYSLWLEHVLDKNDSSEYFWLMWYDAKGTPTIPASGVFGKNELRDITRRLADFIQVP
jgi:hypothetical protein